MGFLDRPAKLYRNATISQFAAVRSKLDMGGENVVIGVGGDSTGVGTGKVSPPAPVYSEPRWVWQFANKLAVAYPAYTVKFRDWNVTNGSYDATVTIQTGTGTANAGGPFTLDIYNGSASGQNPSYTQSSATVLFPVIVDLFLFNHSHNMGTDPSVATFTNLYFPMVRDVLRYNNPNAGVICMSQNPEYPAASGFIGTTAGAAAHLLRATRIAELCATEGWGYINAMQAFLDTPNWGTTLINSDGIHPSVAGDVVWGNLIWSLWTDAGTYGAPRANPIKPDRMWIPGSALVPSLVVGGAPSIAAVNNFLPVASYSKQASAIGASVSFHVPSAWRTCNIWVWWTTTDGAAGNVAWRPDLTNFIRQGLDISSGVNTTALAAATGTLVTGAAPTTVNAESHTRVVNQNNLGLTSVTPRGSRNMVMRLVRDCANASDTYAGTAHVNGILIERAA